MCIFATISYRKFTETSTSCSLIMFREFNTLELTFSVEFDYGDPPSLPLQNEFGQNTICYINNKQS